MVLVKLRGFVEKQLLAYWFGASYRSDAYLTSLDDTLAPFDSLYERLLNNYRIDTGRVFAVGRSAGACLRCS